MQTGFSLAQLADPDIAEANSILRACVHCGFCTATCPTYVLLGDEADSPRGRIYLIKEMLEKDQPASAEVARHIDRCLSCLACMTTCPSGVNYMHLVDQARERVEETFRRPALDRALRWLVVTPDMHRVHHSVEDDEANSNFGFNLPWWDRLFGTYRDQPRAGHEAMTIGIHEYNTPRQVAWLPGMLVLPFIGRISSYAINRRNWDTGRGSQEQQRPAPQQ